MKHYFYYFLGYMPQDLCLAESLTLRETLAFYCKLFGSQAVGGWSEKVVNLLEMESRLDQVVSTMSQGQKRRVSFFCAIGGLFKQKLTY